MFVIHSGRPLQQTAVQVEYVARIGFAAWWASQQQGQLAVCPGVLGQVIVNYQGIAALGHDRLTNGATGVGNQVLKGNRVGGVGRHHDGMFHGTVLLQDSYGLGDPADTLSDGNVDASEVAPFLVDDGVQAYGGLARGPVADDEFTLSAANGYHAVNGLDTRLYRDVDGLAAHNVGGYPLYRKRSVGANGTFAVQWTPQGVHDTPDHGITNGYFGDASG